MGQETTHIELRRLFDGDFTKIKEISNGEYTGDFYRAPLVTIRPSLNRKDIYQIGGTGAPSQYGAVIGINANGSTTGAATLNTPSTITTLNKGATVNGVLLDDVLSPNSPACAFVNTENGLKSYTQAKYTVSQFGYPWIIKNIQAPTGKTLKDVLAPLLSKIGLYIVPANFNCQVGTSTTILNVESVSWGLSGTKNYIIEKNKNDTSIPNISPTIPDDAGSKVEWWGGMSKDIEYTYKKSEADTSEYKNKASTNTMFLPSFYEDNLGGTAEEKIIKFYFPQIPYIADLDSVVNVTNNETGETYNYYSMLQGNMSVYSGAQKYRAGYLISTTNESQINLVFPRLGDMLTLLTAKKNEDNTFIIFGYTFVFQPLEITG